MNKLVVVILLIFIIVGSVSVLVTRENNNKEVSEINLTGNQPYYGPVQIGYNESHFRLYGEHIKEVGK